MTLTLLAMDTPTADFGAVFTKNAYPGAPIVIGRRRLSEPRLGAILVNNKISNVCAPGGIETAERVCAAVAAHLGLAPNEVLPSSTGVIGWRLPEAEMSAALPAAIQALDAGSALPAAAGIMTTDLYPKIRRAELPDGASIVAFAKGAGMIEPNMATMLAYILTDAIVPRESLRAMLSRAVNASFNAISIDGDTSTSDSVIALSSGKIALTGPDPASALDAFEVTLTRLCRDLAEDVVRNGEGVHHVIRIQTLGAPDDAAARALGKAVANAPLFKCAIAGNDPNVGRLVQAVGKHIGAGGQNLDASHLRAAMGGIEIFAHGQFQLDRKKEAALTAHLKAAELYASKPGIDGSFAAPPPFPPHERSVEITLEVGSGPGRAEVLGADLTHEYVSENADYRS
jgi:glutamate N-acetyltransferase/amino-acid N-acetyltransferase